MAELRAAVISLGHADVMTYIQSGNVLFTPGRTDRRPAGRTDTAELAAELERAIADSIGMRPRAVVLSREELARCVHDNPYPGEMPQWPEQRATGPRSPDWPSSADHLRPCPEPSPRRGLRRRQAGP
jgi:uncharacterized protein (DUF1697 family)